MSTKYEFIKISTVITYKMLEGVTLADTNKKELENALMLFSDYILNTYSHALDYQPNTFMYKTFKKLQKEFCINFLDLFFKQGIFICINQKFVIQ